MERDDRKINFCVLASGSKGNAVWIESDRRAVILDCGLSAKEIERRVNLVGLDISRLRAVLISHEHRDHVQGAGPLARRHKIPVLINAKTLDRAGVMGRVETHFFHTGRDLKWGDLIVHPFSISHDCADPVGFIFESGSRRLAVATDLGAVTNLVTEHLKNNHALILEANHDPQMLIDGPYPWHIKMRVRGRQGHLSNEDAAHLLAGVAHSGLETVILGHISETNNRPDRALQVVSSAVSRTGRLHLTAADQDRPGPVFQV